MWHWQHKKIDKLAIIFWGKLFCISLIGHICFLVFIFFIYTDSIGVLHLIIKKNGRTAEHNAPVLFKDLGAKQVSINAHKISAGKKSDKAFDKKVFDKVVNKKSKKEKKSEKIEKSVKKNGQKLDAKLGDKKKTAKNKVIKKVAFEKVQAKKKIAKKAKIKKVVQKQVVQEKKSKLEAPKQQKIPEKIPEKVLEKNNIDQNNRDKKIEAISNNQVNNKVNDQVLVINGQELVGSSNTSLDVRHENLRRELAREWSAPIGIDPDSGCTIKIGIDDQGKMNFFEIVVSSGVLLFDVSVQSICRAKQWPSWLQNSCFSMTFQ